ncbi:malonyl-[acyl-carrier protein] O-methyltransferase BioC [Enterovibrio norvegicus FF-33]|uniref:malonyl-ACP O-methyltransferase BioC n=1 Tax=Enterovibrio TaxID=188143 RepID=UPI0002FADCB4|nr:malonyl-ACP O-methyltransferase BioC [Enterovibrio norvegicus]OEE67621.1 malonyl-[acyl-carrier protein] O-methyltransferase BioC [Enterovibrio norvegicus FF-33]
MSQAVSLHLDASLALCEEKNAIKDAFSRAAATYDQSAAFQRRVGHELMSLLPDWQEKTVLDLGCGTGYFSEQIAKHGAQVIALDLSEQMLEHARARCGDALQYVSGDAESLPFADNSVDVVFTSLALQWCNDLSVPLQEMKRVVRPGGTILFSTLLDGSLYELKQAWSQVDSRQHVNTFLTLKQVNLALAQAGSANHHLECQTLIERYPSALALMKDLKGIGATHLSEGREAGLVGKRTFIQLENTYREFQLEDGFVPATYQVCFGAINND